MTIIATIISKHCTAHAADSFVTRRLDGGSLEQVDSRARKLLRVERWRGVIGYWGLATHGSRWSTARWLAKEVKRAGDHSSAAAFATHLARELTNEISKLPARRKVDLGLGLHFTAYECVDGRWVPELFQIRNWTNEAYVEIRPTGFEVTRETYAAITSDSSADKSVDESPDRRLHVHEALRRGPLMLQFFNGDPRLFLPIAKSVGTTFSELASRKLVNDSASVAKQRAFVSRPIELVSKLMQDFVPKDRRHIGGRTHCVSVTPNGDYASTTGD